MYTHYPVFRRYNRSDRTDPDISPEPLDRSLLESDNLEQLIDSDNLASLIERGGDLLPDGWPEDILHQVIEKKAHKLTAYFLEQIEDPNLLNKEGLAPLHIAVQRDNKKAVELLLKDERIDINVCNKEFLTPVHFAVKNQHIDRLDQLIEAGANTEKRDENNHKPLYYALLKDDLEATLHLLTKNKCFSTDQVLDGHKKLIHWAAETGARRIVNRLIKQYGVHQRCLDGKTVLHYACKADAHLIVRDVLAYARNNDTLEKISFVNTQDKKGRTALHSAIQASALISTKYLLAEKKIDVNLSDENGRTALQYSVSTFFNSGGSMHLFRMLVRAGAALNLVDHENTTVFFEAIQSKQYQIAKYLLLKAVSDINQLSKKYRERPSDYIIQHHIDFHEIEDIDDLPEKSSYQQGTALKNQYATLRDAADHWKQCVDIYDQFATNHIDKSNDTIHLPYQEHAAKNYTQTGYGLLRLVLQEKIMYKKSYISFHLHLLCCQSFSNHQASLNPSYIYSCLRDIEPLITKYYDFLDRSESNKLFIEKECALDLLWERFRIRTQLTKLCQQKKRKKSSNRQICIYIGQVFQTNNGLNNLAQNQKQTTLWIDLPHTKTADIGLVKQLFYKQIGWQPYWYTLDLYTIKENQHLDKRTAVTEKNYQMRGIFSEYYI